MKTLSKLFAVNEVAQHNYVKCDNILEYTESKHYIYYIIFYRWEPISDYRKQNQKR